MAILMRTIVAASCSLILIAGCVAGGNSACAGDGDVGVARETGDATAFDQAGPDVLIAGGNALLPGSRGPAASALLGQAGAVTGSPLAPGALAEVSHLAGPLLSLNGAPAALLGGTTRVAVGAPGGVFGSAASPGASIAVTAQNAASSLEATVTVSVNGTTVITPPLKPPAAVASVPGTTPLTTLVSQLSTQLHHGL